MSGSRDQRVSLNPPGYGFGVERGGLPAREDAKAPEPHESALESVRRRIADIRGMVSELHDIADRAVGFPPPEPEAACTKASSNGLLDQIDAGLMDLSEATHRAVRRFRGLA